MGQSELNGYRVEARVALPNHIDEVAGQTFAGEWKEVQFHPGVGVPSNMWGPYLQLSKCLGYEQANALAWWFYAQAEATGKHGMEVRLVKYKVFTSWRHEHLENMPPLKSEMDIEINKP